MKSHDIELLKRLLKIFDRYINDQSLPSPRHKPENVYWELEGEFSEILDVENDKDALLVQYLSADLKLRSQDHADILDDMIRVRNATKSLLDWGIKVNS